MKFDVVIGNPPYNSSSGGPHGTAGNNTLYRSFTNVAISISNKYVVFVTPKGIIRYLAKNKIVPEYINIMDDTTWSYNTCWFVIDKTNSNATTTYSSPNAIVKKMFSIDHNFKHRFVDGVATPIPKKYKNSNKINGIIEHKSINKDCTLGDIAVEAAVIGPKLISNLYGRKSSWSVTDMPTCVSGFTFEFNTIEDAYKFEKFLSNNKALEYFRVKMNEHKGVVRVCRYLLEFDMSQIITGFEYPKEWNLTQEEIDYVESTIK